MANLVDLPLELLEMIYHFLGSIDDVHKFARTCKKTYDTVQRSVVYIDIMRSIIGQSPQHRYELQLSKMLVLHRNIVEHMQQHSTPLPATQPNPLGYVFNNWERELTVAITPTVCHIKGCLACLPDEVVCDILARYQGLRVLENIWLERQLGQGDYFSADKGSDTNDIVNSYQVLVDRHEMYMDGENSPRAWMTPETLSYTALNADQRARFHSAITCIWLLNEIRWVLTNFAYPARFDIQVLLLENCKELISDQRRVPLLDEMDQYAVHKFMYHHLLPLYGTFLADREVARLPFTYVSDLTKDAVYTSRLLQLFLSAGQTYFQPPDLIDLIVRCKVARIPPYPLVQFPSTTEEWQRPSRSFAFPADVNISLSDERYKRRFLRASLTHLNLITRSSFHQTRFDVSLPVNTPLANGPFKFRDHAAYYFFDRVMVAFEMQQRNGKDVREIREVFPRKCENELWSVWWWANSEDKARAKMERWRQQPPMIEPGQSVAG